MFEKGIILERPETIKPVNQELLRRFRSISYDIEKATPKPNGLQDEIDAHWKKFKDKNPAAINGGKMRIDRMEFQGNNLKVVLSDGISFSDIMYTNHTYTQKGIPATPLETYEVTQNNVLVTRPEFSNATSVGAVVEFEDAEPKFIFNIRSGQTTEPGTVSLAVNGYVDQMPESLNPLIDNLYKETEEEVLIKDTEVGQTEFLGPAQMRGKGCDLIWLLKPSISYKEWLLRYNKSRLVSPQESAGIIILTPSQLEWLFSKETDKILPSIMANDEVIKTIQKNGFKLNPLLKSLEGYFKSLK